MFAFTFAQISVCTYAVPLYTKHIFSLEGVFYVANQKRRASQKLRDLSVVAVRESCVDYYKAIESCVDYYKAMESCVDYYKAIESGVDYYKGIESCVDYL